jgi:carboxypeptidase Taq
MSAGATRAYELLIQRSRERGLLESCATLLEWDEETYMPLEGVEHRSRQRALLAGLLHDRLADPVIGELISEIDLERMGPFERVDVEEIARLHRRHLKIPRTLVEEIARTATIAQHEWAAARRAQDTERLRPHLERIVDLKRSEATALHDGRPDREPYDALLEEFEPAARARDLASLFLALKSDMRPLLDEIRGSTRSKNAGIDVLQRQFPVELQRRFVEDAIATVGFDVRRGRLDTSAHPFCAQIGPGDVRLTVRFLAGDLSEGLYSALHEAGHGLYDQGLDPERWGTPTGDAPSVGLHESQSRLWENFVGRSRGFWAHFFPKAQSIFRPVLDDVDLDGFHAATNRVAPSASRARADMVTYDLHILVRFELERALISGALEVRDLPAAWDEAYEHHLGLRPDHAGEGSLQDGHWASGLFGYFPTYTLGNLIAAQLYLAAQRKVGDLESAFAAGDLAPLLDWLRTHVHRASHLRPASALVQSATGTPLSHHAFTAEVKRRLSSIYGL